MTPQFWCVASECQCRSFGDPSQKESDGFDARMAKKAAEIATHEALGRMLGGCAFADPFYERAVAFIAQYVRDNRPDLLERSVSPPSVAPPENEVGRP